MNSWLAVGLAVLSLLGTGGGFWALFTVRATRARIMAESSQIRATADKTLADTVQVLIGGAGDLVAPLKRELSDVRAEVMRLQQRLAALDRNMQRLIGMIHDPRMTMARLRATVADPTADESEPVEE